MQTTVRGLGGWFYRRSENLIAAMLAVMFAAFLVQVVFRYLLGLPVGWTSELSLVLWGAAFVLREDEEIRFDLFYAMAGRRTRRVMFLVSALSLVALYAVSLPAVVDYVTFMKVEKTAYLKIRFDWLFSVYVVFVVAAIARYLWLGWRALVGEPPAAGEGTGSGL